MNATLKSIFIALFPVTSLYFLIMTSIQIYHDRLSINNIGQLFIFTTIVAFFALLFLKPVARTKAGLTIHTFFIAIGFLTSIISSIIIEKNINIALPSIGLFIGWILYLKWYSTFKNRENNKILKVGNQLPELILEDIHKNEVSTSRFIGNPSIYLFYRGNWCPLCMAQIKEIASQYKELEKRNANVVFISPQPHAHTNLLAKKFGLHFNYLIDQNNKVAKQLQILSKSGIPMGFQVLGYESDTVMPTVIITDAKGNIIFADLTDNYRVRPEPSTFLEILDQQINR
ncbi:peroxiredoxin family protein [Aquimarina sp. 2201CG1-2-11]|uniref:peroxiredoxin family protein n=1 Tax=Aquimarina discodermiae TaxID=3231043 RepID=UPI003462D370